MTFKEFLNGDYVKEHDAFDMIVGDVEMPATVVWDGSLKITEYCEEKYGKLLASAIELYKPYHSLYITSIEILDESISANEGFAFVNDVIGNCSESEYNKLFGL